MSKHVRAIVVSGNGVNCEKEMALACHLGGAEEVDIVHVADLLAGKVRLEDYHFLNFPGGFLDGDDLGSAKAGVNRWRHAGGGHLFEQLRAFVDSGKLVLGVCNGFQLLVKLGFLPALDGAYGEQCASLTFNDGGRFEDRWCWLKADPESPCVFTRGLERLYLPVRHGEGKFVTDSPETFERIQKLHLGALTYCRPESNEPTMDYPFNPNGSLGAIAGICDASGRVFGLMPHPEAYLWREHHPRWTRGEKLPGEGMGVWLFRNAVSYLRARL